MPKLCLLKNKAFSNVTNQRDFLKQKDVIISVCSV